jgi:hypothetical protein
MQTVRRHFFQASHLVDQYTLLTVILGFDKESTQIILIRGGQPDENPDKAR